MQKNKVAGATLEHIKEDNRKGKKLFWEKIAESVQQWGVLDQR